MMRRIALVVPDIANAGGVGSVAEFVIRTIRTRQDFDLKIVSLSVSASDPCSVLLLRPLSWFRGVRTRQGVFNNEPFTAVGSWMGEIETQRRKSTPTLLQLLKECDLIQVIAGTPSWVLPVIGTNKPVVVQVATLTDIERRKRIAEKSGLRGWWYRVMTRHIAALDELGFRKADVVLVENKWMAGYGRLATVGGKTTVREGPPGVNTDFFRPTPQRDPEAGYILTVGRLDDPRKNVGLLLESYAALHKRLPQPPRLVLAGSASPQPLFWETVSKLGLSDWVSFVEKPSNQALAKLYRDAQCFALASDEEGFGVVIIEAMASGIPVVSTRSGGPEGIIIDGIDGFLVPRDNANILTERLYRLAIEPTLNIKMGRAARVAAERRFDEKVAGEAYLNTYDQLLARVS